MTDRQKRILECALEYAKLGWCVLPVHTIIEGKCSCGKDDCSSAGKHPATVNGVKDATTNTEKLKAWFGNGHLYNIGIAAGPASKLAILDIDPKHGGDETIKKYTVPRTLKVITGSGGWHHYFADPEGSMRNSSGKLGDGLDVRGVNGYVVAPPSLHVSGNEYRWAVDPRAMQLAQVPAWMRNQGHTNTRTQERKTDEGPIAEGQRNETLASIAGGMRRQGCDAEAIFAALININQRRCNPPLEYSELKRIADSIAQYPAQEGTVLNDDHPETLAAAFQSASENRWRYNSIDGWSILEDAKYRRIEDDGEVAVALRRFLNDVYIRKMIRGQWENVRFKKNGARIRDILAELAAMDGVHIPAHKHAPASLTGTVKTKHIIAMNNCLLDISTLPPKRLPLTADFYTLNYLPFDYDPEAACPQWKAFLESIFTKRQLSSKETEYNAEARDFIEKYEHVPDELAIEILCEWFGYLLAQETHLQKIFGLIGDRRSGKSTIGKVLRALNGPVNTASPTLTSLSTEFGLQGLMNKTIAIIGDANTAGRSGEVARAVERLKSISGEDGQQINRKNKSYVEVEKLPVRFVLIANKMQDLRDTTGALASRFNFLVTTQSFLGREDHHLESKLLAELPGIFNWALDGLKCLRKRGYLKEHPTGIEAREDFEAMSSPMKAFIDDWCTVHDSASIPVEILWKAHNRWSEENGNKSYSKRKFIIEIKGACNSIRRGRQRLDLSHLSHCYKWDNPLDDNRASVLEGIDLRKDCRTKWDKQDSGTGYGTGYPYES